MGKGGHPMVGVRLEPEVYEMLRQKAEPAFGRAGGVALYVRGLIYQDLGLEMPPQYGTLGRSSRLRKPTGKKRGRPLKQPQEAPGPEEHQG